MEYSEYEAMVELIKEQQKAIDEFMKESRVVLIDKRYFSYRDRKISWLHCEVPAIISTDDALAKEYLKKEFDNLSEQYIAVKETLIAMQQENKPEERKKSSWWQL